MLSAVACPATGMNSFMLQLPVRGSIDSFRSLELVYIRHTASIAPGARAMAWVCRTPATVTSPCQVSGCGHSKVYMRLHSGAEAVSHRQPFVSCGNEWGWKLMAAFSSS